MPYQIDWLIRDQVLFIIVQDQLADEEQGEFFRTVREWTAEATRRIHIITDQRQQIHRLSIPRAIHMALEFPMPRTLGWVIPVGDTGAANLFRSTVFSQFFGVQVYPCRTVHEAINYLRQQDPTLDWDRADYSLLGDDDANNLTDSGSGEASD